MDLVDSFDSVNRLNTIKMDSTSTLDTDPRSSSESGADSDGESVASFPEVPMNIKLCILRMLVLEAPDAATQIVLVSKLVRKL